jgi:hypothetical protein
VRPDIEQNELACTDLCAAIDRDLRRLWRNVQLESRHERVRALEQLFCLLAKVTLELLRVGAERLAQQHDALGVVPELESDETEPAQGACVGEQLVRAAEQCASFRVVFGLELADGFVDGAPIALRLVALCMRESRRAQNQREHPPQKRALHRCRLYEMENERRVRCLEITPQTSRQAHGALSSGPRRKG